MAQLDKISSSDAILRGTHKTMFCLMVAMVVVVELVWSFSIVFQEMMHVSKMPTLFLLVIMPPILLTFLRVATSATILPSQMTILAICLSFQQKTTALVSDVEVVFNCFSREWLTISA